LNPLDASWFILKNVGSADDFGDVSISLDEQQQQKIEAIKRKNAEARKRMMQAKEKPVEIANIMDSPERIRELNPNVNFADGSAPPVPQNNPNPLDLSMESLKRVNEGR